MRPPAPAHLPAAGLQHNMSSPSVWPLASRPLSFFPGKESSLSDRNVYATCASLPPASEEKQAPGALSGTDTEGAPKRLPTPPRTRGSDHRRQRGHRKAASADSHEKTTSFGQNLFDSPENPTAFGQGRTRGAPKRLAAQSSLHKLRTRDKYLRSCVLES